MSVRIRSLSGLYFPALGLNTVQKQSEHGQFSRSGSCNLENITDPHIITRPYNNMIYIYIYIYNMYNITNQEVLFKSIFKLSNEETSHITHIYSYKLDPDVSEVTNKNPFGHWLKKAEIMKLTNEFVARCAMKEQRFVFKIYECQS